MSPPPQHASPGRLDHTRVGFGKWRGKRWQVQQFPEAPTIKSTFNGKRVLPTQLKVRAKTTGKKMSAVRSQSTVRVDAAGVFRICGEKPVESESADLTAIAYSCGGRFQSAGPS